MKPSDEAMRIAREVADGTAYKPDSANYSRVFQAAHKAATLVIDRALSPAMDAQPTTDTAKLVEVLEFLASPKAECMDEEQRLIELCRHARLASSTIAALVIDRALSPAMGADQIKHMAERFLSWKLPENFNPDDGISFNPVVNLGTEYQRRREPTGTNLFDYTQAVAMVQHMLEGLSTQPTADAATVERVASALGDAAAAAVDQDVGEPYYNYLAKAALAAIRQLAPCGDDVVKAGVCANCGGMFGDLEPGREPEELCETCYSHAIERGDFRQQGEG